MPHRYLVTGCAGFIASGVCRLLLEAGHEVVGVDNLNDAYDPRLKQWRLDQLIPRAGFRFHQADIEQQAAVAPLFEQRGAKQFAAVLNLAARAGVRPSVENPWVYVQTNIVGTLNLLELCRQHQVPKFVLASTSSLYGGHNPVPFREDTDTNKPLSPYAASKKGAEALCYTYHHLHGLDVTVLRYFTVYGPAGRPDMSVFRFVRNIAEGRPITVFGDGTQQRDFTYVDCIARGTVAALRPLGFETINLGGNRPAVLNDVIQLISQAVGRAAQIIHKPAHPADVPATWADISRAGKLLQWEPRVPLEQGLTECAQWYLREKSWAGTLSEGD